MDPFTRAAEPRFMIAHQTPILEFHGPKYRKGHFFRTMDWKKWLLGVTAKSAAGEFAQILKPNSETARIAGGDGESPPAGSVAGASIAAGFLGPLESVRDVGI